MASVDFMDGRGGYTLYPEEGTKWEAEKALQLISSLLGHMSRVGLFLAGLNGKAAMRVLDLSDNPIKLEKSFFQAVYPGMMVKDNNPPLLFSPLQDDRFPYHHILLPLTTFNYADTPILYADEIRGDADPLSVLTQGLSALNDDEVFHFGLFVHRRHKPTFHVGTQIWGAMKRGRESQDRTRYQRGMTEYEKIMESKRDTPWYECYPFIEFFTPDRSRIELLIGLISGLTNFSRRFPNQPSNGLKVVDQGVLTTECNDPEDLVWATALMGYNAFLHNLQPAVGAFSQFRTFLSVPEITTLWHVPHAGFTGSTVVWKPNLPGLSKTLAENEEGIILGGAFYNGDMQLVRMRDEDRETHMSIVGRTGVGKSNLMHKLIEQDIADGKGVIVIDPHGRLVRNILRQSIPAERERDVVVLDLGEKNYPIPLNIFASIEGYAALGRVVDIIEQFYATTGVRMDKVLRESIKALRVTEQPTIRDIYRLLTDEHFRYEILTQVEDDETLQTLNDEYHAIDSDNKKREIREPILHRISPFYANELLYPSLCHPDCAPFGEWIGDRKIILISLEVNPALVPSKERNLVGALIISMLQKVGMDTDREPIPFYLYIDEVQRFVTSSLDVIFPEARKYRMYMHVAHQYLGQLETDTMHAIMNNVGTMMVFRSNPDDARAIQPYLRPHFDVDGLVNLDMYRAAAKLQSHQKTQDAFLLFPMPPDEDPEDADERERRIRALSIQQYTPRHRDDVIDWLQKRYPTRKRYIKPPSSPPPDDALSTESDDQENFFEKSPITDDRDTSSTDTRDASADNNEPQDVSNLTDDE